MAPRVSVVVPVRNRPAEIAACLDSLLESDFPPEEREIVCVDNGSTDETPRTLERYGSRIRVVSEACPGPAAARNAGVRAARGERVAFTDSDCVVAPDWLRSVVAPLDNPDVGAVGGRILALRPCTAVALFGELIHDHGFAIEGCRPPYVITMNLACRRATLTELGLFDTRLLRGEDVDFAYRLAASGRSIAYEPEAVVRHRNRETLAALVREGFQHGYYAPKVSRLHREFLAQASRGAPPTAEPRRDPGPAELGPTRRRLYWAAFGLAKRAGRRLGRARAAELAPPCDAASAELQP